MNRTYATTGRSGRALHAVAEVWSRSVCGVALDGPDRVEFDRIPSSWHFCQNCGRDVSAQTDERIAFKRAELARVADLQEAVIEQVEDQGPFGDSGAAV